MSTEPSFYYVYILRDYTTGRQRTQKQRAQRMLRPLVYPIRPRLERGTPSLEGSCSIQLSYRTIGSADSIAGE